MNDACPIVLMHVVRCDCLRFVNYVMLCGNYEVYHVMEYLVDTLCHW